MKNNSDNLKNIKSDDVNEYIDFDELLKEDKTLDASVSIKSSEKKEKKGNLENKFLRKFFWILGMILMLILARNVGFFIGYLSKQVENTNTKHLNNEHKNKENVLNELNVPIYAEKIINEMNKSCPRMVDKYTQIDNIAALPDNVIMFKYTIINYAKEDIDIEKLKKAVTSIYMNQTKTAPEMEIFKEHNTTLKWNYKDKNGIFLFTITVTPEMYN